MAKIIHRHAFVPVPLLLAIERLPLPVTLHGHRLEQVGGATAAPIVVGFSAYRVPVRCGAATGSIDLSASSSWRSEMTLRLDRFGEDDVDRLLLALRQALVERTTTGTTTNDGVRMETCRSA